MMHPHLDKNKVTIAWVSMSVVFLGTIMYPISYEYMRRESDRKTPMIIYRDAPQPVTALPIVPAVETPAAAITAPVEEPAGEAFVPFTRDLRKGDRGADVKRLQEYLNTHGFIIAETGVGSPGHETELFGFGTEAALKKFQEANADIILAPYGLTTGTGIFGATTRALMNS